MRRAQLLKRLKRAGVGAGRPGQGTLPPSPQCSLVLDALREHDGPAQLSELAKVLGLKGKDGMIYTWKKLALLRRYGWVRRLGPGRYGLTRRAR